MPGKYRHKEMSTIFEGKLSPPHKNVSAMPLKYNRRGVDILK
jgi:hypothetical protein